MNARALGAALLLAGSGAHATRPPVPVPVTVVLGPALTARARLYGREDLDELASELRRAAAAAGARGGFTRLDLVLEDARPDRPTRAMIAGDPGLSQASLSVGGARISGMAAGPDGARRLRFAWYEPDIARNAGAASPWRDAERAFELFARGLRSGDAPDSHAPGPASVRGEAPPDPWADGR